jgi:hypothetical protein
VDITDTISATASPEGDASVAGAYPSDAARKAELVGEGVGGVSGTLAGMALGALAGPLGTVIGGIAGAIGGWWAGRAVADAAAGVTSDEDLAFRTHYESLEDRVADRPYEDVRAAYFLGYIAEANPEYAGRNFEEIEPDLERGWTNVRGKQGDWSDVRRYAREAYTRRRGRAQRLGDTPRTMTPTESPRDQLHSDDTTL